MNGLREKFRNKKGFTLIEMLIVVAIIAILVAISIPLVGSSLEKARDATDQANERAAKAEAVIKYLGVESGEFGTEVIGDFWYDAKEGVLVPTTETAKKPAGYGQCTGKGTCYAAAGKNAPEAHNSNKIIEVNIATGGKVTMKWVDGKTP